MATAVLRTVYVDPDVDEKLRREAHESRVSKGEVFRQYLSSGLSSRRRFSLKTAEPVPETRLVLRSVFVDPAIDERLRVEAFDSNTSKNELYRRYLRLGMDALPKASALKPQKPKTKIQAKKAAGPKLKSK